VEGLAAAALDLPEDVPETDAIVERLLAPPTGRQTVRLVTADGTGVAFASVREREPTAGYLDLVAVAPAARRQGIARGLITAVEKALQGYGVNEVRIAGNDPSYGWPGIDVRYTPAVCMARALGYDQVRTAWNMTADLASIEDPGDTEAKLAAAGIRVRRAGRADVSTVEDFANRVFGAGWSWELAESIRRGEAGKLAGCHLALRGDELVGFAAYGALRPSLFGPMGTAPAAQGTGIGGVLLRRCLLDQRAAGLATAQIGWAGPVAFYSGAIGARIERVFLLYRKAL
jgi:predicted N-acetyltransferase YhbS